MPLMTGLSGNEIFCLHLKNLSPGELVIGNSVFSMGLFGSLAAAGRGFLGGEVPQVTGVIHEGRLEAYKRMVVEAQRFGASGITGVTNELRTFHGSTEFLSIASCVHVQEPQILAPQSLAAPLAGRDLKGFNMFTTSADGQELYSQLDAGFTPIQFVFGNVAYSVGAAGGILG